MIVKTEAVVLRTMKYRDTSRIATLYTRSHGKLSVIAKGARDRKSRFGSSLQPMNHVLAVLYRKEHCDLHLLSQCELMRSFDVLSEDLERMAAAMGAIEMVDAVTHGEEQNEALFVALVSTLGGIASATKNVASALYYMELKLTELMGFKPNLSACMTCGSSIRENPEGGRSLALHMHHGGVVCGKCTRSERLGVPVSLGAIRFMQRLQELTDVEAATRIAATPGTLKEVAGIIHRYLQSHVEGMKRLRSREVFAAIV